MTTKSAVPMTAGQRAAFDRDGYLVIRGALGPDETAAAIDAIDRVYADAARSGRLNPDGSMHLLGAGPRPGDHPAVRLAERARPAQPGASTVAALTGRSASPPS